MIRKRKQTKKRKRRRRIVLLATIIIQTKLSLYLPLYEIFIYREEMHCLAVKITNTTTIETLTPILSLGLALNLLYRSTNTLSIDAVTNTITTNTNKYITSTNYSY